MNETALNAGMTCEMVLVTPRIAAAWLATSEQNPRWSKKNSASPAVADQRRVIQMARDLEHGDWHQGSNTIAFSTDGRLLEGHHRLSAIIKSGKSIWLPVVRGITPEGERHIDDNRPRTASARTGINHRFLAVPNVHKAIILGVRQRESAPLTDEEKLRWLDLHPAVYEVYPLTIRGPKANRLLDSAVCLHALMCACEFGISVQKLELFTDIVLSGIPSSDESYSRQQSAMVIRSYLQRTRNLIHSRRDVACTNVVQAGIYDFVNGIPRQRPYTVQKGKYFEMNVARGDKRYTSMFGEY